MIVEYSNLFFAKQRIKELQSQLAAITNERDRLARCLAQIQILMAKYRMPEEGE